MAPTLIAVALGRAQSRSRLLRTFFRRSTELIRVAPSHAALPAPEYTESLVESETEVGGEEGEAKKQKSTTKRSKISSAGRSRRALMGMALKQ